MIENGRAILYEAKYLGVQEKNGKVRLLAYVGKRIPLTKAQLIEPVKPKCSLRNDAA